VKTMSVVATILRSGSVSAVFSYRCTELYDSCVYGQDIVSQRAGEHGEDDVVSAQGDCIRRVTYSLLINQ
jgi:hypothetical protein